MTPNEREGLVARIASGTIRLKTKYRDKPVVILVTQPSRDIAYQASELYDEYLSEVRFDGLYSDEDVERVLRAEGRWDDEKAHQFKTLAHDIEQWKIAVFKETFRSGEREAARKRLNIARDLLNQLTAVRHSYDQYTPEGAAAIVKGRFLIGMGLRFQDGRSVFCDSDQFWRQDDPFLDDVVAKYYSSRISESQYRELARNEPWRSLWAARKCEGKLFDISPLEYTEEQRSLVSWSTLYDNVYQHPKCPDDDSIEDDDCLDGWLILQRRERESASQASAVDHLITNEKIRNSSEIFVMAGSHKDAAKVNSLNDDQTRATVRQRMAYVDKHGVVNEADMPDTKRRIRMELAKMQSQAVAGKSE